MWSTSFGMGQKQKYSFLNPLLSIDRCQMLAIWSLNPSHFSKSSLKLQVSNVEASRNLWAILATCEMSAPSSSLVVFWDRMKTDLSSPLPLSSRHMPQQFPSLFGNTYWNSITFSTSFVRSVSKRSLDFIQDGFVGEWSHTIMIICNEKSFCSSSSATAVFKKHHQLFVLIACSCMKCSLVLLRWVSLQLCLTSASP